MVAGHHGLHRCAATTWFPALSAGPGTHRRLSSVCYTNAGFSFDNNSTHIFHQHNILLLALAPISGGDREDPLLLYLWKQLWAEANAGWNLSILQRKTLRLRMFKWFVWSPRGRASRCGIQKPFSLFFFIYFFTLRSVFLLHHLPFPLNDVVEGEVHRLSFLISIPSKCGVEIWGHSIKCHKPVAPSLPFTMWASVLLWEAPVSLVFWSQEEKMY